MTVSPEDGTGETKTLAALPVELVESHVVLRYRERTQRHLVLYLDHETQRLARRTPDRESAPRERGRNSRKAPRISYLVA